MSAQPIHDETPDPAKEGTSPTGLTPGQDRSPEHPTATKEQPALTAPTAGSSRPEQTPDRTNTRALPKPPSSGRDQTPPAAATHPPTPKLQVPLLADSFLDLAAVMVDDLEKVRIANANRLRILTTAADQPDEDGICRGFGLTEDHRDVARLASMVNTLEAAEHDAVLTLQSVMRRHPLGPWVKATSGVGEKLAARLLAAIGDPYWNTLHDRPRTVSELWAFCGLQVSTVGVAARRRKGEKANWSSTAKTRAYLIAVSCVKQLRPTCKRDGGVAHVPDCTCSPYRRVYDVRRAHTALTHPEWTDMHSHNDGLRIASKELLKDLWREARRLHGVTDAD